MTDDRATSLALADELVTFSAEQFTDEDMAQLQRLLIDYAAVALCGSVQPWGRILTEWAVEHGSSGNAALVGSGRMAGAATAAMVNGTSAHGYELDDTHDKSMSHPGAVVISAALAVGAERASTGRDVLGAIAVGYEAMARVGMAANALRVIERGFHPTGTFGVFGAAAAAAKLMNLDAERLAHAWGVALSMSSGACQFAFEPRGTMVKRMHAGIPAHGGVIAAQLAALGIAAPVQALEGEYGFFNLFGRDSDPSLLRKPAGEPLELHNISFKPYSCCRKFHSLIDALGETTGGFTLDVDDIDRITVQSPETAITSHMMRRPDSVMAAQYSMPYIVGATLAYGPRGYTAYDRTHHDDPRILSIVDKVEAVHDPELDPAVPAHMPNRVALTLRNGETRQATVMDSLGTPAQPMSTDAVLDKAQALVASIDPGIDLDRITSHIETIAAMDDFRAFVESLVVPGYDLGGEGTRAA